ncbi:MAG: VOC family protein [Nitrospirae bacterium]|nr:VOC family protein [Nitrospirota bacterium]
MDVAYRFYREILGFRMHLGGLDGKLFPQVFLSEPPQNDHAKHSIKIVMALAPEKGPMLELGQWVTTPPRGPSRLQWGDLGAIELGIEVRNLTAFHALLTRKGASFLTPVLDGDRLGPRGSKTAYLRDPDGMLIQLVERAAPNRNGASGSPRMLGIHHVGLGVPDLAKGRAFYSGALGFDAPESEWQGTLPRTAGVTPEPLDARVIFLGRSRPSKTWFSKGMIKLVEVRGHKGTPVGKDRRWGDLGLMEIALDVDDIQKTLASLSPPPSAACPRTLLTMGPGSPAYFQLIREPFGSALIELVEAPRLFYLPQKIAFGLLAPLRWLDRLAPIRANLSALAHPEIHWSS